MPSNKLSGIYFGEQVSTIANEIDTDEMILFVVQTNTAITSIDNKLTLFENYNAFETIAKDKGLPRTLAFIDSIMGAVEQSSFYVYSVKTDTSAGFQEVVNSTMHLRGRGKVIYYEETKSANNNAIGAKMTALKTACHNCYTYGAFRVAYVIPYGTITDAVTNKGENVTNEEAVITSFTSLLNGEGDGRLAIINPDNENASLATIASKKYNEEPGFGLVEGNITGLTYNFTYQQMLTLRNLGVIFIRPRSVNGSTEYEIELGVSTGYKDDKSDGLLVARNIADELLHQVDLALTAFIKDKQNDTNVTYAQTAVDAVIAEFVDNGDVDRNRTELKVAATENMSFALSGRITTIKPIVTIDVSSVIY